MSDDDWTSLSVRESTRDRFNTLKQDHSEDGVPEMSADLFLKSLMDTLEAVANGHYVEAEPCPECGRERGSEESCMACEIERIVEDDDLGAQLDRVESAVGTVEERTGRIERTLDELGGNR